MGKIKVIDKFQSSNSILWKQINTVNSFAYHYYKLEIILNINHNKDIMTYLRHLFSSSFTYHICVRPILDIASLNNYELISPNIDSDLYISYSQPNPTYILDEHDISSITFETDCIRINPLDYDYKYFDYVNQASKNLDQKYTLPVYIGVYGHAILPYSDIKHNLTYEISFIKKTLDPSFNYETSNYGKETFNFQIFDLNHDSHPGNEQNIKDKSI
ncbi:unnamed protein product [Gordionus sp. m RMFG-2023]